MTNTASPSQRANGIMGDGKDMDVFPKSASPIKSLPGSGDPGGEGGRGDVLGSNRPSGLLRGAHANGVP